MVSVGPSPVEIRIVSRSGMFRVPRAARRRRTGSGDSAHARSWAASCSSWAAPPGSRAGGDAVSLVSSFLNSSIIDGTGGAIAGDGRVNRQRRTRRRPVRFVGSASRPTRPSPESRRRHRWTVAGVRPIRRPIERSEGQQTALSRAQYRRARRRRVSVGVSLGSAARSWGSAANGGVGLHPLGVRVQSSRCTVDLRRAMATRTVGSVPAGPTSKITDAPRPVAADLGALSFYPGTVAEESSNLP